MLQCALNSLLYWMSANQREAWIVQMGPLEYVGVKLWQVVFLYFVQGFSPFSFLFFRKAYSIWYHRLSHPHKDQTLGGKRKNDGPTSVRKHVLANYILVHTCTILYSGLAEHTCQHPGVFRQGFHFFQCIVVVCQLITGLNDTLNTRLNKTLEILLPTESIARQYQESQTM